MQGNGGGRDPFSNFGDPFAGFGNFGGLGGNGSLFSSVFGGKDPFDDPFFTQPFGGVFGSNLIGPSGHPFPHMMPPHMMSPHMMPGGPFPQMMPASAFMEHQTPQPAKPRGPIIEELNSDDETEDDKKKDNPRKHSRSSGGPSVEHPDDENEERKSKQIVCDNNFNMMNNRPSRPQTRSFSFHSSSVTYGGADGAYYTSSRTRREGSDGLTFEESKEADTASGKATHRISKGIHDKGHSVTRRLNADGRVDRMQTLHNLNEDQLPGFEEAWMGNASRLLPGWTEGSSASGLRNGGVENGMGSRGGWALPSTGHPQYPGNLNSNFPNAVGSSRSQHLGRAMSDIGERRDVRRSRAAGNNNNTDKVWRR